MMSPLKWQAVGLALLLGGGFFIHWALVPLLIGAALLVHYGEHAGKRSDAPNVDPRLN